MDLGQLVAIFVPLATVFTLAVIVLLYLWLRKQDTGTQRMREIAHFIQIGANTFLRREFLTITPFAAHSHKVAEYPCHHTPPALLHLWIALALGWYVGRLVRW